MITTCLGGLGAGNRAGSALSRCGLGLRRSSGIRPKLPLSVVPGPKPPGQALHDTSKDFGFRGYNYKTTCWVQGRVRDVSEGLPNFGGTTPVAPSADHFATNYSRGS